jgi:hypothetical protein
MKILMTILDQLLNALFVLALSMLVPIVYAKAADAQTTFRDSRGVTTGTASTDSQGNTTFRDSRGSTTGTASTDSQGNTTFRDAGGRTTGTASGGRRR